MIHAPVDQEKNINNVTGVQLKVSNLNSDYFSLLEEKLNQFLVVHSNCLGEIFLDPYISFHDFYGLHRWVPE